MGRREKASSVHKACPVRASSVPRVRREKALWVSKVRRVQTPMWVNATQSDVQLGAFGGTVAASRVINIGYNSLINKPGVVLPGYLPPIALTSNTQELTGLPSGNSFYAYTSSVSPDSGFSLFRLSGFTQEIRFNSVWSIVITLALTIP